MNRALGLLLFTLTLSFQALASQPLILRGQAFNEQTEEATSAELRLSPDLQGRENVFDAALVLNTEAQAIALFSVAYDPSARTVSSDPVTFGDDFDYARLSMSCRGNPKSHLSCGLYDSSGARIVVLNLSAR